ncbi:MAG: radical SAM protein [Candidatus Woesearchaeota archaeon]
MKIFMIFTGQPCEIDCIYCKRNYYHYQNNFKSKSPEDVFNEVLEIIKNNKEDNGDLFFHLTGVGEPLMLSNIREICQIMHENKISFLIETNGIKLKDENFLGELVRLGLKGIILTICSIIEEEYRIITQSNYFEDVLIAIENIEKFHIPLELSIPILKQNLFTFHLIPIFLKKYYRDLNLQKVNLSLVRINSPTHMFKECSFRISDYSEFIEDRILYLNDLGFVIDFSTSAGVFPFCFFKRLTKKFKLYNKSYIFDGMRQKTVYCLNCFFNFSCPGPSSTYLELYGDEEFKELYFSENSVYNSKIL